MKNKPEGIKMKFNERTWCIFVCLVVLVLGSLLGVRAYGAPAGNNVWGDAKTDQERCQAEADYMVKYRQFRHVGPCIGRFEGIGYGGHSPNLGTCTPRYKMRLTGDAVAQTPEGTWVRVRSWR